jgi:hypothetical protein
MRRLFLPALFFLFCLAEAQAIDLTATGGLIRSIGRTDLASGAGSNLQSTYTDAAATTLDVSGTAGAGDNWRIEVRGADTAWDPALSLQVRRDGNGSGNGSIEGGSSFIEVTGSDTAFFTGAGDRSGIAITYRMTGMGIHVPPGSSSTTVLFTVVDTP